MSQEQNTPWQDGAEKMTAGIVRQLSGNKPLAYFQFMYDPQVLGYLWGYSQGIADTLGIPNDDKRIARTNAGRYLLSSRPFIQTRSWILHYIRAVSEYSAGV